MITVTKDGHTATFNAGQFVSDNPSFTLWLNTAHVGFTGDALRAHLEATGCTVTDASSLAPADDDA
jgi:hypothetical protein